jgi:hypothetical protein
MSLLRRLMALALLLALAACALPLTPVLIDQPPAPVPATLAAAPVAPASATPESTAAEAPAPTDTAALVTAVPDPLSLADHLPLAVWGSDGSSLALQLVHPLTGAVLPGAGWDNLGASYNTALAPDGRTLALLVFSAEAGADGTLRFIDLPTWTVAPVTIAIETYPMLMQFSADSRSLVVAGTDAELDELVRYDVAAGTAAARVRLPFTPHSAGLSPDGARLLVYGTAAEHENGLNPVAQVAALALDTLAVQWTAALPAVRDGQYVPPEAIGTDELWALGQWYTPAVIWAPGTPTLYLVHAGADQLTTVDFAARTVSTTAIAPALTWHDRLLALTLSGVAEAKMLNGTTRQGLLAPDGRLYVLGLTTRTVNEFTETPLGLQVIDPASGLLLSTVDTAARTISLGADSSGAPVLLLEGWGDRHWTEVRPLADPARVLAEFRDLSLLAGHLPSGQAVLLGREDRAYRTVLHVIDPATWSESATWPADGFAQPLLLP